MRAAGVEARHAQPPSSATAVRGATPPPGLRGGCPILLQRLGHAVDVGHEHVCVHHHKQASPLCRTRAAGAGVGGEGARRSSADTAPPAAGHPPCGAPPSPGSMSMGSAACSSDSHGKSARWPSPRGGCSMPPVLRCELRSATSCSASSMDTSSPLSGAHSERSCMAGAGAGGMAGWPAEGRQRGRVQARRSAACRQAGAAAASCRAGALQPLTLQRNLLPRRHHKPEGHPAARRLVLAPQLILVQLTLLPPPDQGLVRNRALHLALHGGREEKDGRQAACLHTTSADDAGKGAASEPKHPCRQGPSTGPPQTQTPPRSLLPHLLKPHIPQVAPLGLIQRRWHPEEQAQLEEERRHGGGGDAAGGRLHNHLAAEAVALKSVLELQIRGGGSGSWLAGGAGDERMRRLAASRGAAASGHTAWRMYFIASSPAAWRLRSWHAFPACQTGTPPAVSQGKERRGRMCRRLQAGPACRPPRRSLPARAPPRLVPAPLHPLPAWLRVPGARESGVQAICTG